MSADTRPPIPKIIIQTHRSDEIYKSYRQTWIDKHPGYEYRFFNDDDCERFFYEDCPELKHTYKKLPLPVQKADLFRYAYVCKQGGIYSDVDTICHSPVHKYIDLKLGKLVVGTEMTPSSFPNDISDYTALYHTPFQILQWSFAAPPNHPALKSVLNRIRYAVNTFSASDLETFSKDHRFTLELTGPMMFTDVLLGHLSDTKVPTIQLLVQNTWGYNPYTQPPVCEDKSLQKEVKIEHLYAGSWR